MGTSVPGLEQVKASMRATWMAGDFGVIARTIAGSAEAFVARLPVKTGDTVLDVACGTGNVTIPLAKRGTHATGVDIATNLLVQARERAENEGVAARFDEGDAEQLPYADEAFDAVTSMFGAMFAPRPELVVQEAARVLRPGGLLAMANWNPASFSGKMFRVGSQHAPPPPGVPPPVQWGDPAIVRERLAGPFESVETELIPVDFDLPMSVPETVLFFQRYFGPTKVAYGRLDEAGQAALTADLEALWSGANVAPEPANRTLIRNEYLQVTARRRRT